FAAFRKDETQLFIGIDVDHRDGRLVVIVLAREREGEAARADLLLQHRRQRLQGGEIVEFFAVLPERRFETTARGVDFGVEVFLRFDWLLLRHQAASIRLWKIPMPPVRPNCSSETRSGCGMSPITLPRSFMIPAMSRAEPLGLSR